MDPGKQELVARLTRVADCLAAAARHAAMQDWSEIELTMPQLRALGFLGQAPRRMGDLAAYLGSSVSSATSLVERLEGKGLVERVHDPGDRRVVMVHLTADGRELIERFWRMQRLRLEWVADALTIEELARVVEAMELLAAASERQPAAAAAAPAARG